VGVIDPDEIDEYMWAWWLFWPLEKAFYGWGLKEIIQLITDSGLRRARWGRGFPTGVKGNLRNGFPWWTKLLLFVTADEGDPGASYGSAHFRKVIVTRCELKHMII